MDGDANNYRSEEFDVEQLTQDIGIASQAGKQSHIYTIVSFRPPRLSGGDERDEENAIG